MIYTVTPIKGIYDFDRSFDPAKLRSPWNEAEVAFIADYPWLDRFPAHFEASARLGADADGINVLMVARETPIIAKETRFGGMPCEDSCLEFFLCPFPEDGDRYLNIEINPIGAAHVGVGDGRYGRKVYQSPVEGMTIKTFVTEAFWAVSYNIPNGLFDAEFQKVPGAGQRMKGNFYKCSGSELHEHYGCWNHVAAPKPDFHRPECFGDIILRL